MLYISASLRVASISLRDFPAPPTRASDSAEKILNGDTKVLPITNTKGEGSLTFTNKCTIEILCEGNRDLFFDYLITRVNLLAVIQASIRRFSYRVIRETINSIAWGWIRFLFVDCENKMFLCLHSWGGAWDELSHELLRARDTCKARLFLLVM